MTYRGPGRSGEAAARAATRWHSSAPASPRPDCWRQHSSMRSIRRWPPRSTAAVVEGEGGNDAGGRRSADRRLRRLLSRWGKRKCPRNAFGRRSTRRLRRRCGAIHRVVLMGEDVAGGQGAPGEDDAWGGPLGVTKGLMPEFGRDRVLDTPITESGFIGAAIGAAATGLRPVADLMFVDFMGVCFDQIFNQAAKFRYMFGGKAVTPVVIRTMYGAGFRAASQHSQCLYPLFTHIPGLKVVIPSNAYDAKGLLIQAIRDDDPVIFFEHKMLYDDIDEVPDEPYTIPFGEANLTREGRRRDHRGARPHGEDRQRGGGRAGQAGRLLHGDRPAHDLADGHGHDPRIAWRKPGGWWSWTRRIRAATWPPTFPRWWRRRRSSALKGADPHGDAAAHAGAVRAGAGGHLHPARHRARSMRGPRGGRGDRAVGDAYDAEPTQMSDAIKPIGMPKWGLAMTEGKVNAWLVGRGRRTSAPGDEILEIETSKITNVFESPVAGLLRRQRRGRRARRCRSARCSAWSPTPTWRDAEIDAFVDQSQAGPGRSRREAPPPEPMLVPAEGWTVRVLTHGAGGDRRGAAVAADPRLRRRPAELAVQPAGSRGRSRGVRDRPAGPWRFDEIAGGAAMSWRLPTRCAARWRRWRFPGSIWSGTRWAARSRCNWRSMSRCASRR